MDENSGFAEILPGEDADLAIAEVGTLIKKLASYGDEALTGKQLEEWDD